MGTGHKTPLTSAEIGILWNEYIHDSLSVCVQRYALACEQDEQICSIIKEAISLLEKTLTQISQIFQADGIPIPTGFADKDVSLAAPPLFSSIFRLQYIKFKADLRMPFNGISLARSSRSDIRKLFRDFSIATMNIDDKTTNLLLNRGLYIRPPYVSVSDQIEFVQHRDFMSHFFGDGERKLLAIEIASLFFNIQNNLMGKMLLTGFSQVAQSPDIRRYALRGIEIANKHIDIFSSLLRKEDIPVPAPWDSGVTNSTVAPFSDRLMLQHIVILNQLGITGYAMAMTECLRKDLFADYGRLAAEIGQYLSDGANIMIDNHWMEEPPKAVDHGEIGFLQ
jgi:hypothetical protein